MDAVDLFRFDLFHAQKKVLVEITSISIKALAVGTIQ